VDRIIFHVDVNSAFLSWTATQMVQEGKPDIRLVPSVISGDPKKRTSVVLAKSIPAKAFHINTGEPVSMALRKCPDLVTAPPDFALYSRFSKAFKDICRAYAPVVEEFSIDECFMDMTGTQAMYPDIIATAYELKDKIREELGFTVNVGIGSNKLLAKMASDFEKPDKVHTLFTDEIEQKMWGLSVRDLLFLGKASTQKLEGLYIRTIGELARADLSVIKNTLGNKAGEQMHRYANGIDDSPVAEQPRKAKSYGHSVTLEEDVTDFATAENLILALCDAAASRLRADGLRTANIAVNIRDSRFKNKSHQRQLETPTDITDEIYQIAVQLLHEVWKDREPLRLLGVSLGDVSDDSAEQFSLFDADTEDKEKKRHLDAAVDSIRSRFGDATILRGATMNTKRPKKKK